MDERMFSVKEIADTMGKHTRTIQRWAEAYQLKKYPEGYLFTRKDAERIFKYYYRTGYPEDVLSYLLENNIIEPTILEDETTPNDTVATSGDNQTTPDDIRTTIAKVSAYAAEKGLTMRVFTDEEWDDIVSSTATIENQNKQIELHQEQIQYLRTRIEKQDEVLQNLSKYLEQRNYIEAKDKGYE